MNLCDIAELRGRVRRELAQCTDDERAMKLVGLMNALDDAWEQERERIRARDEELGVVEEDEEDPGWVEDSSWVDDAWSERVYIT